MEFDLYHSLWFQPKINHRADYFVTKYPDNFSLTKYGAFLYIASLLYVTFSYFYNWNQHILLKDFSKQHSWQTNDEVGKEYPRA